MALWAKVTYNSSEESMKDIIDRIRKNSKILDVYVGDKLVGNITKRLSDDQNSILYRFTYNKQAKAADFVSLTMPVRDKPWDYKDRLHPVFQQNLPEGAQLSLMLQRFGKIVMDEDMVLLGMTGAQSIGRVKVVPHGFERHWNDLPSVDMAELKGMNDTKKYVLGLLDIYAPTQGVCGQMPKVLADAKMALKTDRYIIKTETDEYAGAAISEALCQQAAMNTGMKVASGMLSEDGLILASERFDVDGFEDMCSVLGMDCHRKMQGGIEKIARAINAFSTDPKDDLRTLFKWHIFNMAAGNSESHLKNLGFVYDKTSTRIAPLYDMLSTRAFDNLRHDLPSLMVGSERKWEIDSRFVEVAGSFGVQPDEIDQMKSSVRVALLDLVDDLPAVIEAYPHFSRVGANMADIIKSGCDMLSDEQLHPIAQG